MAYAASELKVEIADYMIASHGSTIPLMIYREVQVDWDFSGNSDNFLLLDPFHTIKDDLDEAFTNQLHKNIMSITTPILDFSAQDKHSIINSIANETPLPDKWAFTDKKGHKCTTFAWLTGNVAPKANIAPSTSFSPSLGQKRPAPQEDKLSRQDKLDAIRYCLPLPKSTQDANLNMWTTTINQTLDICHEIMPNSNPTV
ncbi:hypothetical protein AMATHDRAFT_9503 [Amanita thiersii Skay4041]|uniref:Uncharacterized protein n=1 Tax=Amanita thiersii Skay4041 TaxID=703135 RepID=A0A2A9NC27_9AGAR|nr:hypothetical protein AMATHDRAFT_9503 [Amanita thiersii Skay4041]